MRKHLTIVHSGPGSINGLPYEDHERLRESALDQIDILSGILKTPLITERGFDPKTFTTRIFPLTGYMAVALDTYVYGISPEIDADTISPSEPLEDRFTPELLPRETKFAAATQKNIITRDLKSLSSILAKETPTSEKDRYNVVSGLIGHHSKIGTQIIHLGLLHNVIEIPRYLERYA